jgi:hypothetical protein
MDLSNFTGFDMDTSYHMRSLTQYQLPKGMIKKQVFFGWFFRNGNFFMPVLYLF